jgi:hypothetical protein
MRLKFETTNLLYHGENKLNFDEMITMMIMSALY